MPETTKYKLLEKTKAAGCAAKIPPHVLTGLLKLLPADPLASGRLLTATDSNEDAAVVSIPQGVALVQTLDFFTPIVNDPFAFGQIAAANSLSDVYAMGGAPWCAMNIVCFPVQEYPVALLADILAGGASKLAEAGVALAGGHSVNDPEIKYGLSVTGLIDPESIAANTGLKPGQALMLTKPLGTGILSTAVKACWDGAEEIEADIIKWASRLNVGPSKVISELRLTAATDITGFGLGGHLLEMAQASDVDIELETDALPLLPRAVELTESGLLPAGSFANKKYRMPDTRIARGVNEFLVDIVFDAQTSGGVVLALERHQVERAREILSAWGDAGHIIGAVLPKTGGPRLHLR